MRKRSKSQSALEYLTVFGIAMIIVIVVGATLYQIGVFSTPKQKVYTGLQDFTILDWKVSGDKLTLVLAPRKDVIIYGINVSDYAFGNWSGKIIASPNEKLQFEITLDREIPQGTFYKLVVIINYTDIISKIPHLGFGTFRGYAEKKVLGWYFSNWRYRQEILISGTTTDLYEYQVPLNVSYIDGMNDDFSDLRFTYVGSEVEIPYWIEKKADKKWAYVWIKIPHIPANRKAKLYMYFGNPNATSESNYTKVFEEGRFYDEFLNTDLVEELVNVTVSNDRIQLSGNNTSGYFVSKPIPLGTYRWALGGFFNASLFMCVSASGNSNFNFSFYYYNETTKSWELVPNSLVQQLTEPKCAMVESCPPLCHINRRYNLQQITPEYNSIKFRVDFSRSNSNTPGYIDWVELTLWKRKFVTNLNVSFGKVEAPILINITSPESKEYLSLEPISVPIIVNIKGWYKTYNVNILLDGKSIYYNESLKNDTTLKIRKTFFVSGNHTLFINASADGKYISSSLNFSISTCSSSLGWWNDSFNKRRKICINSSYEVDDYQLLLNISYDSDMQSDFDDIRFTYFNGSEEVEIPHYIEENYSNYSMVWVKVPHISSTGYTTIYMYYGNASAASESNASQVFDFYDGFETWNGWTKYRYGVVSQSSDRAYRGIYSLKKDLYGDPSGGYKDLGFTLNYPFVLEAWVYRSYLSGSNADRLGVIDASGNGYGPIFAHTSSSGPYLGIDKRTGYSASVYGRNYTSNALNYQWYFMQFTWNAGNMTAKAYDNSGNLVVSASTVDTSYSSFTRVYVFGGYTYYVDELRIRKYIPQEPNYTILEEEERSNIKIDIFEPMQNYSASCVWNITLPFNFTVYGPYDEYNVSVKIDGTKIYDESITNNTNVYFTYTTNKSKLYEATIVASSGNDTITKNLWVNVDITKPFVNIFIYSPQNKTYIRWPNVTIWINFTLKGCYDNYNASVTVDNNTILQDVVPNNTMISLQRTFDTNATHHLFINASNEIGNASEIYFTTTIANKSWYYSGWVYRKPIYVKNNANKTLQDYQLQLTIDYSTNMQPDFSDIRFTYFDEYSGSETPIPYWKEYGGNFAIFWVKIPQIPANENTTIYMYYGNPAATDEGNASQVFDFYDGIENGIDEWEDLSTGTSYIIFNKTNETRVHGNYSIKVWMWRGDGWAPGNGWNPIMRRNVTVDENHSILLWYNYYQFGGHLEPITFRDESDNVIVGVRFRYHYDPDDTTHINNLDTGKVWPLQTWGRLLVKDINTSTKTVDVYLYYANLTPFYLANDISWKSTSAIMPITKFKIVVSTWHMRQPAIYYFDSLAVFKYVEPEPTYTFGSEEVV